LSKVISIFIDCQKPLKALVPQLETLLSFSFKEVKTDPEPFFEARTPDSVIAVGRDDYDNDRDLNFKHYTYEIEFRPIRDKRLSVHESRTWSHAQQIFHQLKSELKCDMMLVDDLQKKLGEFHPSVAADG
jgi:hypothetical protein